jgi:pimeloyl-ACP methyl ester carboxylesterase
VDIAPKYGVRVIALHRRDYGGSTPFTEAEVAPIEQTTPEPAAIDAFMTARAIELANFVQHVIESKAAVAPCDGKGGIALLGWSLGNLYGLDFLLRVRGLSDHLQASMKIFVRSFLIFGTALRQHPDVC